MTDSYSWPAGSATGIGSLPGTDAREAARIVVGELPELPYLPELPGRGAGAELIGRTAALLVDLPVELVPSGYRATARPGRDHRRAVDLLRTDLDALEEALESAGVRPQMVKVQSAGPWTLTSEVELPTGHKVLTDPGALREFAMSLAEGLRQHVAELSRRWGVQVVVQLDEPSLPAVLAGGVPTPSGYGTVPAVPEADAVELLRFVLDALPVPRIVHCCAPRPPLALLRRAGADALAVDADLLAGAPRATIDALGEAWDAGASLLLGLVPAVEPAVPPTLAGLARPALDLVDRLGFPRSLLAERCAPTPSCGLAGATASWALRAHTLVRELGQAFLDPPDSWL
ncbi:MAG TPA: methionine synthase [Pseudonocardiaceae bacterium]|jgi:methionine synthase II (cobalamin-independent)|nr:methionine synthase [Pseudonocardiaceae bacterium]